MPAVSSLNLMPEEERRQELEDGLGRVTWYVLEVFLTFFCSNNSLCNKSSENCNAFFQVGFLSLVRITWVESVDCWSRRPKAPPP